MSIIRPMRNDDLLDYKRLCSICYTYTDTAQPETLPEELLRIRMGAFDESGRLLSAMMQIPYEVRFAGETVRLVGIGGVVTDPTARGQRCVRKLFEEGLPRLHREGYVFSALYPFSHQFYRKFGFEWAEFRREAELPRTSLRTDLQQAEEIIRVLPDEEDMGMRDVYEAYITDKYLSVIRTEQMWQDLRKGTPWESLKHAYVLKADGRTVGYWIGMIHKENGHRTLHIKDMAWTCRRGLEGIFSMLCGMNEIDTVHMRTYGDFDPRMLVKEPSDVSWKGCCEGMVRVVNVERALALIPAPPLPGMLTVSVTDEQIPDNNGYFAVNCDGYSLSVERSQRTDYDLSCDIQGLAALVAGRQSFDTAVSDGVAKMTNERRRRFAAMLFGKHDLHMNHDF
ncbi:MAG: GNAT family N-acetyltransferase [Clostridia bacterium]|nr:GNAT family N-acetyltransferase [Clostridia bacterium]